MTGRPAAASPFAGLAALLRAAAMAALLAAAAAVPFAFAWRMDAGPAVVFGGGVAAWALALAVAAFAARGSGRVWPGTTDAAAVAAAEAVSRAGRLLAAIVAVGVVLRLAWVVAFPPLQFSDYGDYWDLAVRLVETGEYVWRGTNELRAWRPPGYSLMLAGLIWVTGPWSWLPTVSNLAIYAATAWIVFAVGRAAGSARAGLIAAALVTVWPSYVAVTGFSGTEPISILLVAVLVLLVLRIRPGGAVAAGIAIGIVAGVAALVRPTFMVVPVVVAATAFLTPRLDRARLAAAAVALVAMAATIAPWTVRNYTVFGEFVPVSTNGGDILYRANNPLATGGYTSRGVIDTDALKSDEVAWDRRNQQLAVEWIKANPVAFAKLAVRKAGIFLGTDETGVYLSLRAAAGGRDVPTDDVPLAIAANLFWIALWLALGAGLLLRWRAFAASPALAITTLFALLLLPIHMIYESQPRYHMPMIGPLAVLAAWALCALRRPAG
ncbi:MAG: ArnT family glycosyltransferase [Rhodospirillales bacterium]